MASADDMRRVATEYRKLAAEWRQASERIVPFAQVMPGSELAAASLGTCAQLRQCVGGMAEDLERQARQLDESADRFETTAGEQRDTLASLDAPLASIPRPL